jgi:hypothetical protein
MKRADHLPAKARLASGGAGSACRTYGKTGNSFVSGQQLFHATHRKQRVYDSGATDRCRDHRLIAVAAPSFLGNSDKAHDSVATGDLALAYKVAYADRAMSDHPASAPFMTGDSLRDLILSSEPQLDGRVQVLGEGVDAPDEDGVIGVCRDSTARTLKLTVLSQSGTTFLLRATRAGMRIKSGVCSGFTDGEEDDGDGDTEPEPPEPVVIAPRNDALPTITGSAVQFEQLQASPGLWTGTDLTLTYEWQRCVGFSPCYTVASGADRYQLTTDDIGAMMQVVVSASNSAGTASATSARTAQVRLATQTVAGSGTAGYLDGAAATAQLNSPTGLAIAADGGLLFADTSNRRVRRVLSGNVTTIAGTSSTAIQGDGSAANTTYFNAINTVAAPPNGNMLIGVRNEHVVRSVMYTSPTGVVGTVAGIRNSSGSTGDGGAATAARLKGPSQLATYPHATGNNAWFIADTTNHVIRRVNAGIITTFAGRMGVSGTGGGEGVAATSATFNAPRGVAVAPDGSVIVGDTGNGTVRKVRDGTVTTVARGFSFIESVAVAPDGTVFVVDSTYGELISVRDGRKTTLLSGLSLTAMSGVAARSDGTIYVTDSGRNRILSFRL